MLRLVILSQYLKYDLIIRLDDAWNFLRICGIIKMKKFKSEEDGSFKMVEQSYGWLSLLPPIVAMILVLTTKEVLFSLFGGVLAGALVFENGRLYDSMATAFNAIITGITSDPSKVSILIFLGLLGALVVILTIAGGARAYGDWASKKIKNKVSAQLLTCLLGVLFCIDDYFHFLASSVIMKPITERHRISSAKLAYLLDATAAPICVIMPVSSWAAAIVSILAENGVKNPMGVFMRAIPYNLYSLITIVMVIIVAFNGFEFSKMASCERRAMNQEPMITKADTSDEEIEGLKVNSSGRVIYMVLPIVVLVFATALCMLKTGGYFASEISLFGALEQTDVGESLVMGSFFALLVAFVILVPKKIVRFRDFMAGITAGVKTMLTAFLILILAWAMSNICGASYLNTSEFVRGILSNNFPVSFFPIIMFAVACFLSFATGTSWGTFGIFIPIVALLCRGLPDHILVTSISATLAGAVFGDHVSPISDTTVLAATGAGCNYLEHIYTQMPYAMTAAVISGFGYLIAGFSSNLWLIWGSCLVLLVFTILIMKFIRVKSKQVVL